MNQRGFIVIILIVLILAALAGGGIFLFGQKPKPPVDRPDDTTDNDTDDQTDETPDDTLDDEDDTDEPVGEQVLLSCVNGAENKPRVSYSWKWSDISENAGDADNPNYVYLDSTQFSIAFLKKLHAYFEGDLQKSEFEEFEVYMMKDFFSQDFKEDFDDYYRTRAFLDAPSWYKNEDRLSSAFEAMEFPDALPSPGKYRVAVENIPDALNEVVSQNNIVQQCQENTEGCKNWTRIETCTQGNACVAGSCTAVCNNCGELPAGTLRCSPSSGFGAALEKCEYDSSTQCLEWKQEEVCTGKVCMENNSGGLSCLDVTEGDCANETETGVQKCGVVSGSNVVRVCEYQQGGATGRGQLNWRQVEVCSGACSNGECITAQAKSTGAENYASTLNLQGASTVQFVVRTRAVISTSQIPLRDANVTLTLSDNSILYLGLTNSLGRTAPVELANTTSGTIRVLREGYQEETQQFNIPASATANVSTVVDLTPNETTPFTVTVVEFNTSNRVSQAELLLEGMGITLTGQTVDGNAGFSAPTGDYNLFVEKDGYQDFNAGIRIDSTHTTYTAQITPLSEGVPETPPEDEEPSGACGTCANAGVGDKRCALPIKITFTKIDSAGEDNPFYYLPLNGKLGINDEEQIQREGYGVGFNVSNEAQVVFSGEYTAEETENGSGAFETTMATQNSVGEVFGSKENLLEISLNKNSTSRALTFSPSIPVPVLMEIDASKIMDGSKIVYTLSMPEGTNLPEARQENVLAWSSVEGCFDPSGARRHEDKKESVNENIGDYSVLFDLDQAKAQELAQKRTSTRTKVSLKSIFYYPASVSGAPTLEFKEITTGGETSETGVTFYSTDNQSGNVVILNSGANTRIENIQGLLNMLENQGTQPITLPSPVCLTVTKNGSELKAQIKWKTEQVEKAIDASIQATKNTCLESGESTGIDCSEITDSCESIEAGTMRCDPSDDKKILRCQADESLGGCKVWKISQTCTGTQACAVSGLTPQCVEE